MTDSEAESVHAPSPMEGHGAYNRSSRVQAAGLAAAIPLLRHAAETVPLAPAPEPIVIADYGCSEGHNSLIPMREAIAALRQRVGTSRTISVVHTDLPSNDFSALFEALENDPELLSPRRAGDIRLCRRQIVLPAASSLQQRDPRLELLVGAMALAHACPHPRSGAGRL